MRKANTPVTVVVLLALACAAATAACASGPRPAGLAPYSPTLGPYVYYEEGPQVLITVGTFATRARADSPYFPIEIGLANKDHVRTLVVARESFSVQVGDAEEIPAATVTEVIEGYKAQEADRNLFRSREFTATKFDRYRRVESAFYPNSQRRSGVVRDYQELPSGTYMLDVLYFRSPGFSLRGQVVRLLVRLRAGDDPLVVAFKVE